MNNSKRFRIGKRTKDILFIGILAFILLFASWKIFGVKEEGGQLSATMSETETKVSRLLSQIDGVGQASVMICETEDGAQSAVVVCEGANDLQVIMDVREAVAAALGMDEKSVKIYLKKV